MSCGCVKSGYVADCRYATGNADAGKKQALLSFRRADLLYDIAQIAYVEGDVMIIEDEHERHQVQDIIQDGNLERVDRVMSLAFAEIREDLYPLTREDIYDGDYDGNAPEKPGYYYVGLRVPKDFSRTTLNLLCRAIHEFVVYKVLVDWLSITALRNMGAAARWSEKLEYVRGLIIEAKSRRHGRVRRTLTPF